MKYLFTGFLLTISLNAFATLVPVAASNGRLINHTGLPSEAFKLSFSVSCTTGGFRDCGAFEIEKNLNADGTYEIPAFELDAGKTRPQDRKYSLFVFLSLPSDDARFPVGVAPSDLSLLNDERGVKDLSRLKAQDFTLFRASAGSLDVRLKSGRDLNEFMKNEGRDLGVSIEIDFGLTGTEDFSTTETREQSGFSLKRWTDVRETYFLVNGALPADAAFDYAIEFDAQTVKSGRLNFAPTLIDLLGEFTIDDGPAQVEQLPAERKLTGLFPDTNFFLDYALRDQYKFAEIGFSYATLQAECVNGKIQGELIYRDGQFVGDPETSRVPVSGTCQGETGTLMWPIETRQGKTVMLSAPYVRIRAQKYGSRGTVARMLFTDDVYDSGAKYKGDELSMFLTVRLPDGTYAGHISVGTDD